MYKGANDVITTRIGNTIYAMLYLLLPVFLFLRARPSIRSDARNNLKQNMRAQCTITISTTALLKTALQRE